MIWAVLLLGLPSFTYSFYSFQEELLDPPTITSHVRYDQGDGMAANCLQESFQDSKGRLWLNPCDYTAQRFRFSFYQYDGEKSYFYDIIPPWISSGDTAPLWYAEGEDNNGFLFGRDISNSIVFSWHPDTREQFFFRIGNETKLLNMQAHSSGGVLILFQTGDTYQIHRWDQGKMELVSSITLDFKNGDEYAYPIPFDVNEHQAWFFHQAKGLVMAELVGGQMEYFPWETLSPDINFKRLHSEKELTPKTNFQKYSWEKWDHRLQWSLTTINDNRLLLFLGVMNGIFSLDTESKKLIPQDRLNKTIMSGPKDDKFFKFYFGKDSRNNILMVWAYLDNHTTPINTTEINFQAHLLDYKGNWYDYTQLFKDKNMVPELEALDYPKKFFGSDFRFDVGWSSLEGLSFVELQPNLKILQFPLETGARAITPINENEVLLNSDLTFNYRLNLRDGTISHRGERILGNPLSSVIKKGDTLWLRTKEGELSRYDLLSNDVEFFRTEIPGEKFIFLNPDEIVLFSTDGQVFIYSISRKRSRPFQINNEPFDIGSAINELLWSEDDKLWVAALNGLWQLDFQNKTAEKINISERLNNVNILSIHKGDKDDLWLGTANQGILIFNYKIKKVKQITTAQGLSNNTAVGILKDMENNRWVSTFDGISVLDHEGNALFDIGVSEGLLDYEFNRTSYQKFDNGKLAFGGLHGIVVLDPEAIIEAQNDRVSRQIYLTELNYHDIESGRDTTLTGTYSTSKPLKMRANHRYLTLNFAISDYVQLPEQSYSYRLVPDAMPLEEVDQIQWIELGAESKAIITNIPPGNYKVQVNGVDHRSNQSILPLEVPIIVSNYFYRTWWFFLLVFSFLSLLIWLWVRRLTLEKKMLEKEVFKRTKKIREDKETIEKQAIKLKELDEAKTRFFTNISHEFRTPLTVIQGMSRQIQNQPEIKHIIGRNVDDILNLVNQILELRKLESGLVTSHYQQGDIIKYVQYILQSFYTLAEQKEISLKFESQYTELFLDYDSDKVLKILSNLLMNAIKFTHKGGEVILTLEVKIYNQELYYLLSVKDSGEGIPKEKIEHIFDRFYQVDDKVNRTGSGTGIGLTLVKELVELMDGKISVDSHVGQGTQFTICMPLTSEMEFIVEKGGVISQENAKLDPSAVDIITNQDSDDWELPLLLIIEDNPDVTIYLKMCLSTNFRLLFARDGEEGLSTALEKVPDIILSDVLMPKLDGMALCKILKSDIRTSHIPVILLTAKADMESKVTGLQHGADAYLTKPFNESELQVRLNNLLELRRKLQQRYSRLDGFPSSNDLGFPKEDSFMSEVKETILEHMAEEGFGVPKLCRLSAMSRTQLHNKLKSLTGNSTSHLIRSVRIEKAKELLVSTDLNVSQIASEIGIESISYFSRIFREDVGLGPNKYRSNLMGNNRSNI